MGSVDLDRYVRRLAAVCEARPPASRSETVTWLLWPLLDGLGWERDGARSGEAVGLAETDLILSVPTEPPTPALFVASEATDEQLSDDRVEAIASAMARTGIDRALYANGRDFLCVAGVGDDRLRISAAELPSRADDVTLYARESLRTHCEDLDPASRAARRFAVFRDEIADSIATQLETALGTAGAPGDRTLSDVLDAVDDSLPGSAGPDVSPTVDGEVAADSSSGCAPPTAPDRSGGGRPGTQRASRSGDESRSDDATTPHPTSVPPESDPAGEYVVRVFNERGSIGAVGHSTSAGALVEAASYFFERGLSGIRVPWSPEDGPIVINDAPVDDAGTRWNGFEQLSNGLYVNTAGSVAERAGRVEALADRAGLRVMLSGDWSGRSR